MTATPNSMRGISVAVVSRCAWTLVTFRRGLLQSLLAAGAQPLAVGDGRDGCAPRLRDSGIAFQHVDVARRGLSPLQDLALLLRLARLFRQHRPDVVHCFTIKPAIYGTFAAALAGVPARVVTITGLGHAFTSAPAWLTAIVSALYRAALSLAHVVQFQNAEDRDLFVRKRIVDAAKTRLVAGSGVDIRAFAPQPLPAGAGRSMHFLMIARLIREKGVLEFIEAAQQLRQLYPDVRFSLLGGMDARNPSGFTGAQLQAIQSSQVVRWLGETHDVRPSLSDADVVVLPSYREGLPRALLEAAAMGRPAVASDVPGCRQAVVDGVTGYLVPARDVQSLAAAMRRLIDNPHEVATMGAAARARVTAHFDESTVVQATLDEYRRLLAARPGNAETTPTA
jgi:glycosyltransferase involved in cell wall biosynthesis